MKKTPMMILRDKLLVEIQKLKKPAQCSTYIEAYREALINVANDIDDNMIQLEKKLIIGAYCDGEVTQGSKFLSNTLNRAKIYYKETFETHETLTP